MTLLLSWHYCWQSMENCAAYIKYNFHVVKWVAHPPGLSQTDWTNRWLPASALRNGKVAYDGNFWYEIGSIWLAIWMQARGKASEVNIKMCSYLNLNGAEVGIGTGWWMNGFGWAAWFNGMRSGWKWEL